MAMTFRQLSDAQSPIYSYLLILKNLDLASPEEDRESGPREPAGSALDSL
jgi:hypothetical protein